MDMIPVGAAEGCDLLILSLKRKIKRSPERGPSLRQLLRGETMGKYAVRLAQALKKA